MLNQTSGLPDFVATNHFVHITQTSIGSLARIESMASGPLHFIPGSRWEYSNSNISQEKMFADMATGYWRVRRGGSALAAPESSESWIRAAGAIVTTVDDLTRWDMALENGKVVDRSDLREIMSPATLSDGKKDDYGFGWWIDPVHGYTDVYHDGDTYGMSSINNIFPALHHDIIVLENESMDRASVMARAILSALRSPASVAPGD